MTTVDLYDNPYAPPQSDLNVQRDRFTSFNGDGVVAVCRHRGWLSRIIDLKGSINAEIRYEGLGFGERVYVDGALVARTPYFGFQFFILTPHIDFLISDGMYDVPASIDVYGPPLSFWGHISRFSLTVGNVVVYRED
ncbi:MAG: hypothetical protein FJ267_01630 [Planctomycetes bacterium]|nr:hypothetical protein [Planctomycetota bacterium]